MRRIANWAIVGAALVGGAFLAADRQAGRRQLAEYQSVSDRLDQTRSLFEERLTLKDQLATDYLTRRATFPQVVDQFQRLNADGGQLADVIRSAYPAADDREVAARNAVNFIVAGLPSRSPRRPTVLAELRADFARLFPAAGTAF